MIPEHEEALPMGGIWSFAIPFDPAIGTGFDG